MCLKGKIENVGDFWECVSEGKIKNIGKMDMGSFGNVIVKGKLRILRMLIILILM